MIIQIACALVPLALILLFIREKVDYNRLIKIAYYMTLSIIGITVLGVVKAKIFPNGLGGNSGFVSKMIPIFMFMALPEEIFKYLTIKKMNAKNQRTLIKDIFITSTVFMFFENYAYSKNYFGVILFGNVIPTSVFRMFIPIHLLSQIIMAYFMIKAFNEKEKEKNNTGYLGLSLAFPIIVHTLYNTTIEVIESTGNVFFVPKMVCLLGIITYILTFIFIRKMLKKYNTDNQEIESVSITKTQLIVTVLFTIFWIYSYKM